MTDDDAAYQLLEACGLPTSVGEGSPIKHIRTLPQRDARSAHWPDWVPAELRAAYRQVGATRPYSHQQRAAEALHAGQHVILATGTASGKSLGTQLPGLAAILGSAAAPGVRAHPAGEATMLYLSPTKALAADQLDALEELAKTVGRVGPAGGIRPASYDGDTDPDTRGWVRRHANVVLTNPDMLNAGILPNHRGWARFFARLRYVIIDEAHTARGIFGSHTALLLRRLRRVARSYGADPVFAGASATSGNPASSFARLIGEAGCAADDVVAVTEDGSPHAAVDVYLWESSASPATGDQDAPLKRSLTVEAADILTDLVVAGFRSLAFIKSRRGAETIATIARDQLRQTDPALRQRVAAYRSGFLKEERRALEDSLRAGALLGVASTPALELGIDIAGLDAVIIAGLARDPRLVLPAAGARRQVGPARRGVLHRRRRPAGCLPAGESGRDLHPGCRGCGDRPAEPPCGGRASVGRCPGAASGARRRRRFGPAGGAGLAGGVAERPGASAASSPGLVLRPRRRLSRFVGESAL